MTSNRLFVFMPLFFSLAGTVLNAATGACKLVGRSRRAIVLME
jgi:hypothetical protein